MDSIKSLANETPATLACKRRALHSTSEDVLASEIESPRLVQVVTEAIFGVAIGIETLA